MTGYRIDGEPRVRVEQAIARGESPEWMVTHLGVSLGYVFSAMLALDEAAREPDRETPGAGKRKAS